MAKGNATLVTIGDAPELIDFIEGLGQQKMFASLWRSPEKFAQYIATIPDNAKWSTQAWKEEESTFYGPAMSKALDMAFTGWPEGAGMVQKLRDRITLAQPMAKRFAKFDVAGAYPDVGRFLAGNPQFMRRIDNATTRRRPVLTLLVNIAVNCHVAADRISRRAATVAAIVDLIEERGYSCGVVAAMVTSTHSRELAVPVLVTVKEPHDAADIGRLAMGCGNVAMFRKLGFAAMTSDAFTKPLTELIGTAREIEPSELLQSRGVYVFDALYSTDKFTSDEYAIGTGVEKMIESLRKQNCPAFRTERDAA